MVVVDSEPPPLVLTNSTPPSYSVHMNTARLTSVVLKSTQRPFLRSAIIIIAI